MVDLDRGLQALTFREDSLGQPRQRHRVIAEAAELRRCDVRFGVPEGIEHTDERRALPGEVVQVQQLEATQARRAQAGLDLLLVAEGLQLPGSHQ